MFGASVRGLAVGAVVAFQAVACGHTASRTDHERVIVEETPSWGGTSWGGMWSDGGSAGNAVVSVAGSGSGGSGGASVGQGGMMPMQDPPPPWEDRCAGKPRISTASLPSRNLGEVKVLDDLAVTRNAIAVDAERVYYIGDPPPGVACPGLSDCTSVLSVPKDGGEVRVHGAATFTQQIALDEDSVYWTDGYLYQSTKQGGAVQRAYQGDNGLVATGNAVYAFAARGLVRANLPGKIVEPERVVDLPDIFLEPRTLLSDGDWAYFAEFQTSSPRPVYAVRLSDGKLRVLASIDIAQGAAIAQRAIFLSEESTHSVMRIDLDTNSVSALCVEGYPTALAADASHIYLNLETLSGSQYSGNLVRLALDGSDACVVAPDLEYLSAPALDSEFVYWTARRQLHKLPKQ